ncbi:MAG: hypothetical protein COU90_04205 [Candidatus Ryanbacteria bacterium CG10_big_fil_rev_8_21_14_0_10_43_42]|uniref:SpoVT-AbrB domain-containing protein n=1 Tax=Candidatus Ryanbacteria bacterium CG10_big_fil_rev_8_21_14_0_10_43_42 TaxID=1974864 RepID=A0A2M8KVU8_9BACT|nr:MAG: hypothetical protein COU90_04205 [Candidatus Ryanbacteria bacterium CG10_big_fil_rev_8_21_14_0_10_43_42]
MQGFFHAENMARRKREDYTVRSLNKISNGKGYSVTLPIEVIRLFRWQRKQKLSLQIDKENKRIIITDWEK